MAKNRDKSGAGKRAERSHELAGKLPYHKVEGGKRSLQNMSVDKHTGPYPL